MNTGNRQSEDVIAPGSLRDRSDRRSWLLPLDQLPGRIRNCDRPAAAEKLGVQLKKSFRYESTITRNRYALVMVLKLKDRATPEFIG
ncbi:hypothetical protein J6590_053984 [Homalodisca vitripennis]|nr:hypothetical protein J6590_053984 [Homalodisca vitripennis]